MTLGLPEPGVWCRVPVWLICACSLCCSHVLVYKLGGASLSVTVMQVNGGIYRVLKTHTDPSVGGESFTEALAKHLATEFKR